MTIEKRVGRQLDDALSDIEHHSAVLRSFAPMLSPEIREQIGERHRLAAFEFANELRDLVERCTRSMKVTSKRRAAVSAPAAPPRRPLAGKTTSIVDLVRTVLRESPTGLSTTDIVDGVQAVRPDASSQSVYNALNQLLKPRSGPSELVREGRHKAYTYRLPKAEPTREEG